MNKFASILLVLVLLVPSTSYAAIKKEPSCSIKAPSKAIVAGEKVKISWKSKNAKTLTWTSDAPNVQLNLSGTEKKKGKKTITTPISSFGNAYKVTLAATSKDGKISFCSASIITTGATPGNQSSLKATIDEVSLKQGTTSVTLTGTAPNNAALEIYVAQPNFTGLTDYKNIKANMMFEIPKKVMLATLMTFDAGGAWSARTTQSLSKGSRIFVFDAKTGSLLVTKTI